MLVIEGRAYLEGQLESVALGIEDGTIVAIKKTLRGDKTYRFGDAILLPGGIAVRARLSAGRELARRRDGLQGVPRRNDGRPADPGRRGPRRSLGGCCEHEKIRERARGGPKSVSILTREETRGLYPGAPARSREGGNRNGRSAPRRGPRPHRPREH